MPENALDRTSEPVRVTVPQQVLPLPGGLDDTAYFTSNSPEIVLQEGILLSTFPSAGKAHADAHLDLAFTGRFDVFLHHIADSASKNAETLCLGIIVGNAGKREAKLDLLGGASYLTRPEAPFAKLGHVVENQVGSVWAGPGNRVCTDLLLNKYQQSFSRSFNIVGEEILSICLLPIPVRELFQTRNGRSGIIRLESSDPVHVAILAAFLPNKIVADPQPTDGSRWIEILNRRGLVVPRDKTPTLPENRTGQLIYGRVAGVGSGSTWNGSLANSQPPGGDRLSLKPGEIVSFPISTVIGGTLGTNQIQSAPLVVRYPDTAYQSHGNYGVTYQLELPLHNNDSHQPVAMGIRFQSPLKDWNRPDSLQFFAQPPEVVTFRGSLRFDWIDSLTGQTHQKIVHITLHRGQQSESLVRFSLAPGAVQNVRCTFIYPPDCTPPQVLTVMAEPPTV